MDYRSIIYKKESGVATITLNRPRALNALNAEMIDELLHAVGQAGEDPEVKVLLLTGAGRAFCFGGRCGVVVFIGRLQCQGGILHRKNQGEHPFRGVPRHRASADRIKDARTFRWRRGRRSSYIYGLG